MSAPEAPRDDEEGRVPKAHYDPGLRCPECDQPSLLIVPLRAEDGYHQHTRYICTCWPRGASRQCGWEGWTVPLGPIPDSIEDAYEEPTHDARSPG